MVRGDAFENRLNDLRTSINLPSGVIEDIVSAVGDAIQTKEAGQIAKIKGTQSVELGGALRENPILRTGLRGRTVDEYVDRLTKRVLDEVRVEPTCRRLMTVQGVGPLTALVFRATIDRPDRFHRSRDVGAHLGLTPRRYQSGETDVQGRISRCGDELAAPHSTRRPTHC